MIAFDLLPCPRKWKEITDIRIVPAGTRVLVRDPWSPGGWLQAVLPFDYKTHHIYRGALALAT
jgi:hypothetical protein